MDNQTWLKDRFIKGTKSETLMMFIPIEFTGPSKFDKLVKLLDNIFYNESNREIILDTFSYIQRVSYAISRFKAQFRFKRARIYNTEDLYMNPISPDGRGSLVLLQNDTKYIFHIRELIHSIKTSLSHCCHFFADPIICKNPYTNLPFTKSALYNIYFTVKGSSFLMPTLFHRYFLCNFDYMTFCLENGEMVNDEYLKTYVENYCLDNVYSHVEDMFNDHRIKFRIHKLFPKDILFETMKPYLKLYFISNFSINIQKKRACFDELSKKIHAFIKFNPSFGKRKVKMTPLNPFSHIQKCSYYFDSNSIPLLSNLERKKENTIFMTSHLDDYNENESSSSEEEEMRFDSEDGNQTPTLDEDDEDEAEDTPHIEPMSEEYNNYITYFHN